MENEREECAVYLIDFTASHMKGISVIRN